MLPSPPLLIHQDSLNCTGRLLMLDEPVLMGILNLTPDSFSDGGLYNTPETALARAKTMLVEGATIIDIGGYSSRPGAADISVDEELSRVVEPFRIMRDALPDAIFSIDTFRADVAEVLLGMGCQIVNDISGGLLDGGMLEVVARYQAPYILMHMQGTPQTMQQDPQYVDVVNDVWQYFVARLNAANAAGVGDVVLDVGFGFGKSVEHNYQLFNSLARFTALGHPLVAGISRKSMLSKGLGRPAAELMPATAALHLQALEAGVRILRVHDVAEAAQVVKLFKLLHPYHGAD